MVTCGPGLTQPVLVPQRQLALHSALYGHVLSSLTLMISLWISLTNSSQLLLIPSRCWARNCLKPGACMKPGACGWLSARHHHLYFKWTSISSVFCHPLVSEYSILGWAARVSTGHLLFFCHPAAEEDSLPLSLPHAPSDSWETIILLSCWHLLKYQ